MRKRILSVLVLLLLVTIVYTCGNPTHVIRTEYTVKTDKITIPYKLVFISDVHYGCVQDKAVVYEALTRVNEECADVVLLGGDIVQSPVTSKNDMEEIFMLLGHLSARNGIYFIYGNHDAVDDGTAFDSPRHSDCYAQNHLTKALHDYGIGVLCDSSVYLGDSVILIGRDNVLRETGCRSSISELVEDSTKYSICVDHVPTEYTECMQAGIDLHLSGHTHGGQLFPINLMERFIWKMPVYGKRNIGCMTAIVSSGMGVGAYNARNVHHCEYVVINVVPNNKQRTTACRV